LGFSVTLSQANFVWCRHPHHVAKTLFDGLKARNIFIRLMRYPGHADGIRITVGTPEGTQRVLDTLADLMAKKV
jgi:histidinol-phosphate aminotransferase